MLESDTAAGVRILIVSDYAYPLGGAEGMIQRMREGWLARGADARIFSTDLERHPGENFADYRCFGTEGRGRTLLQVANPWASDALARVLDQFDPDIVHVRMFLTQLSPLILHRLAGRRAIYHLAWYRAICPTGRKSLPDGSPCREPWGTACVSHACVPPYLWPLQMAQLRMARDGLHRFQAIVSNSAHVASVMAQHGIATEVIHNGIVVPPLDEARSRHARAPQPTFLFAGRLSPEKGCHVLLDAFAIVAGQRPDARLEIAGAGSEAARLAARVASAGLGDRVRFLGHLSSGALREQTRRAWAQVIPSVWDEPFGVAALDAMAEGRAVVASAAGGLAEIVEHGGTGYLVQRSDPDDLARRLLDLANDPAGCEAMGVRGHARVRQQFSLDRCLDQFQSLHQRLLSRPVSIG